MAGKKQRVAIIADKRTWGARPGAVAHPLKKDIDAWLAKGWRVVEAEAPAPVEEPQGETPEE